MQVVILCEQNHDLKLDDCLIFYYQTQQENEQYEIEQFFSLFQSFDFYRMKEKSLYRSVRKEMRAKELLRQSRLPFSNQKPKLARRSMSVNDLARIKYEEHSFKPKTNGYYVPNYDKNPLTIFHVVWNKENVHVHQRNVNHFYYIQI